MSTSLVYLHVPKSAGTSHRAFLIKVFGEGGVFWYGLHSDAGEFDADDIGDSVALGGHRPLSFYPDSFDALYTSVVRDPVERAVSFFNYCAAPSTNDSWQEKRDEARQEWQDKGIDPSSMVRSIENCEAFRIEISNMQCVYLSRHGASFEGVQRTLQEEDMVIGEFSQVDRFNEYLRTELNFPMENKVWANVGQAGYSTNILQEPGVTSLIRSINREDQELFDFVRLVHNGLYVSASAESVEAVKARVPSLESRSNLQRSDGFDWAKVQLFGKGMVNGRHGRKQPVPLVVRNMTDSHIVFSRNDECKSAIGWQIHAESGEAIEGTQGVCKVVQNIPAQDAKAVMVEVDLGDSIPENAGSLYIQFCIVENGEWMWDKSPLNSAWSRLYV